MDQTYQYKIADSILGIRPDEYALQENEYYRIYSFYVTYSMCGTQSDKKRLFTDYGWQNGKIQNTQLGSALTAVLNLNRNNDFVFTEKDDLRAQFSAHDLNNGELYNVDIERAVIGKTSESNNYLRLFYRVRDGLAHGKYKLRFSSNNEKMVIIQDNNRNNVTARIVIKLSTLLEFVNAVDINGII